MDPDVGSYNSHIRIGGGVKIVIYIFSPPPKHGVLAAQAVLATEAKTCKEA